MQVIQDQVLAGYVKSSRDYFFFLFWRKNTGIENPLLWLHKEKVPEVSGEYGYDGQNDRSHIRETKLEKSPGSRSKQYIQWF